MKIFYLSIFVLTFVTGMYIGHKNIPNYIYHNYIKNQDNTNKNNIINEIDTVNFDKKIRIKNLKDVDTLRANLIKIVWNQNIIPSEIKIDTVFENANQKHPFEKENISSYDIIQITTNEVIKSKIIVFYPKINKKNEAVIYQNGHGEDPNIEIRCINRLLKEGFIVIRINMPLKGENEVPTYYFPNMGNIKIENHEILNYLPNPYLSYFAPIRSSILYVKEKYNINTFHMMGISGGGWTTQLYAAMDTTIKRSYAIAGSVPIEYRFISPYDKGDAEQHDPRIYSNISYPEIYVLGAAGYNRSQIHILNKYDPCCFQAEAGKYYKKAICEKINMLKVGEFQFIADSTEKTHTISDYALEHIIQHLNSKYTNHTKHACTSNIW